MSSLQSCVLTQSCVSQNTIPEVPGVLLPVNGYPHFLTCLRITEAPMTALAGALLDEPGRLQFPNHLIPGHCNMITYR